MCLALLAAAVLGTASASDTPEEALELAMSVIEERFPGQVDRDALYGAAIAGLAEHLDEALGVAGNRLITIEEYAGIEAWHHGERSGVGIEFSIVPSRGLLLTEVYPDSPAAKAKLVKGDLVVGMDDHPLTGLPVGAIHEVASQAQGDRVVLDVRRADGSLRRMTLARRSYHITPVRRMEDSDVVMLRVAFFGDGTAEALARELARAGEADAVALDLRDTQGGLLDEVVAACDLFLSPGAVVVHRVTADGRTEPVTVNGERVWKGSVVILANRGTEGPAEAFIAALQDHRVAMVVGTATAGRSWLPSFHPLGAGLVLQLADTSMQGPSGRVWAGHGVDPDVLVEPTELTMPAREGEEPLDLQRDAAVRLMRGSR